MKYRKKNIPELPENPRHVVCPYLSIILLNIARIGLLFIILITGIIVFILLTPLFYFLLSYLYRLGHSYPFYLG